MSRLVCATEVTIRGCPTEEGNGTPAAHYHVVLQTGRMTKKEAALLMNRVVQVLTKDPTDAAPALVFEMFMMARR